MNDSLVLPWQDDAWRRLHAARAAGRMPHALLLAGPAGLGKSRFARRLAHALVCAKVREDGDACGACPACRSAAAGSHPDLAWLTPEAPGKAIRIDAIRALGAGSVLAAQQGGYRVYVIDPADAMNRAAANALLKTLEEPTSRTIMVLVSSVPHRLPATIRSRCQTIDFRIPPLDAARIWLAHQAELTGGDGDALLAIAGGAPLRALAALQAGWREADATLLAELAGLRERRMNPVAVIEEWAKRPLTELLEGLQRCFADLVRLSAGSALRLYHPDRQTGLQSLGQGIDLRQLFLLNDELIQLVRNAGNNLNAAMAAAHLVNRWLQITRAGGR